MPDYSLQVVTLLTHIILELPASINFILRPSFTLSSPSPVANPVIRQYGLLLAVVNGLLGVVLFDYCRDVSPAREIATFLGISSSIAASRISGQLVGRICGILSLYHAGPLIRAVGNASARGPGSKAYGGPTIIATVHAIVGAGLLAAWLRAS